MIDKKILILEDDADLLSTYVQIAGIHTNQPPVVAQSYKEMIHQSSNALICHVALLDVNLGPGQPSGIDAFHWLVGEDFKGRIYFVTGHGQSHPLVEEACRLGKAVVLSKPMKIAQLLKIFAGENL